MVKIRLERAHARFDLGQGDMQGRPAHGLNSQGFQLITHQERQLQCLIGIQARVARGMVTAGEVFIGDIMCAADTFR